MSISRRKLLLDSSLTLQGLKPLATTITEVTGVGLLSLVATFDGTVKSFAECKRDLAARLVEERTPIFGGRPITIVSDISTQPAACQN